MILRGGGDFGCYGYVYGLCSEHLRLQLKLYGRGCFRLGDGCVEGDGSGNTGDHGGGRRGVCGIG